MIFLKIYCNMDNLKIDNVNVEYNFMFQIHLVTIQKNCNYDSPNYQTIYSTLCAFTPKISMVKP